MRTRIGPGWKRAVTACTAWLAAWLWLAAADAWAAKGKARPDVGRVAPAEGVADPRARLAWLRAEIARNDELYFRQAAPEITDAEYDRLKRELQELEAAHPELAVSDGVAANAGGDDRSGMFPTHRHLRPMLGLAKAHTEVDLRAFVAKMAAAVGGEPVFVIEPKYDGVAVSAIYERGRLTRLVTRGDGREGDDVTANAGVIAGLPDALRPSGPKSASVPLPDLVELRGEVYVNHAEFARINAARAAAGDEPLAHPRNLAAGTLKALDADVRGARRLAVVFYGWGAWEGAGEPATQQELHERLRAWTLPTVGAVRVVAGWEETWAAVREFARAREAWPFPTDGVVVKLDAVDARRRAGDGPAAPPWAVAYKFQPARAVTRLRAITVQIGRSGVLTPVAELEPVALAGATVTRATLHNRAEIARRDLRVGDTVIVERAGEVIPAIVGVELAARPATAVPFEFPRNCPECGVAVLAEPGEATVRCGNDECPAQVRRRLEYFAAAVGIKGLGPATIGALVGSGRLRTIAGLYRLSRADLLRLDGVGPKSADRLLAEIERSKTVELGRLIAGLGLPGVGPAAARRLAAEASDLRELLEAAIAGTGPSRAGGPSSAMPLATPPVRMLVEELLGLGVNPRSRAVGKEEKAGPVR